MVAVKRPFRLINPNCGSLASPGFTVATSKIGPVEAAVAAGLAGAVQRPIAKGAPTAAIPTEVNNSFLPARNG